MNFWYVFRLRTCVLSTMNNILNISPLLRKYGHFSLWYLACDLVEEHVTLSLHKTRLGKLNFHIHSQQHKLKSLHSVCIVYNWYVRKSCLFSVVIIFTTRMYILLQRIKFLLFGTLFSPQITVCSAFIVNQTEKKSKFYCLFDTVLYDLLNYIILCCLQCIGSQVWPQVVVRTSTTVIMTDHQTRIKYVMWMLRTGFLVHKKITSITINLRLVSSSNWTR
jgi:hypothetical protein